MKLLNIVIGLLVASAGVRAVETTGFERYQIILDRSPFGASASVGVNGPAPNWAEQFVLVGVVPDPLSTNVLAIIQDKERAYLKAVGESIGEVKVKEIESAGAASKVVVQRGLEVVSLHFKDRAAGGVPVLPTGAVGAPANPPVVTGQPNAPVIRARRIPFRRGD